MPDTALFCCPRCGVQKKHEVPLREFLCPDEHRRVGADFPQDHRWCYCTECRFFFYIGDPEEPTVIVQVPDRCPSRKALQKYVRAIHCPYCGVLSLFTQPPPQDQVPPCPGCGSPIGLPLFRHRCEHIAEGVEYLTRRAQCPFCGETFTAVGREGAGKSGSEEVRAGQPAAPGPTVSAPPTTVAPAVTPPPTVGTAEPPQSPLLVKTLPAAPPAPPVGVAEKPLLVRTQPQSKQAPAAPPRPPAPPVNAAPPAAPVRQPPAPAAPPAVVTPQDKPGRPSLSDFTERASHERGVHKLVYMTFIWLFFPFIFLYEITKAALRRRSAWGLSLLAILATFALGAAVIFGVKHFFLDAFPRQFVRALSDGRVLEPPGDCALDLYLAEKEENPAEPTLSGAADELKAEVLPEGEKAFKALADGRETGIHWDRVEKIYAFLAEAYPSDSDSAAKRAFARGQHALILKAYQDALDSFRVALSYKKDWPLALVGAGKALLKADPPVRDETLALRYFEQAGRVDPKCPWGYRNMGDYYASKGNVVAAEAYLRKAVAAAPDQPGNLLRLGDLCLERGKTGEAERFYRMSLMNQEDSAERQKIQEKIQRIRARQNP